MKTVDKVRDSMAEVVNTYQISSTIVTRGTEDDLTIQNSIHRLPFFLSRSMIYGHFFATSPPLFSASFGDSIAQKLSSVIPTWPLLISKRYEVMGIILKPCCWWYGRRRERPRWRQLWWKSKIPMMNGRIASNIASSKWSPHTTYVPM